MNNGLHVRQGSEKILQQSVLLDAVADPGFPRGGVNS